MRPPFIVPLLLATLGAAPPAAAQSPALQEAWGRSEELFKAGRSVEAEPWAKKAVSLAEREFGGRSPAYAQSLDDLGSVYGAEARYGEAERLLRRALAIREAALGRDSREAAESLIGLGEVYLNEGRFAAAEASHKRALAIDEKVGGPDSAFVALDLNNLAVLYNQTGRYADARPLLRRSLAINEKIYGPDSPEVAINLGNLASLHAYEGRDDEAETLYRQELAIDEKASGPDAPDLGIDLNNLGDLYADEGRPADALPLYQRALAIGEKTLGPDNPDLAVYLNNLASAYVDMKRLAEAEALFKRTIAIQRKALGAKHPKLATSIVNLAHLYAVDGRYAEAQFLALEALGIREKALPPDHSDIASSLGECAWIYRHLGRYRDAEPLQLRALAIRETSLGPDHPSLATSLGGLAELYALQDRYGTALPYARRATAIFSARAGSGGRNGRGQRAELQLARSTFLTDVLVTARLTVPGAPDAAALQDEGFAALQWSKASDTAAAVARMAARFAAGSDRLAAAVRARQDAADRLDALDQALLQAVSRPSERRAADAEDRLRQQSDALRQALKQQDASLAAAFPSYAELAGPQPITIAAAQKELASGQALLVFAVGETQSFVAVVTPDAYAMHVVPVGSAALEDAVRELRRSLDPAGQDDVPPFAAGAAYRLYQQLLAPAETALRGVRHLFVVTDGALESLPLGVLLTDKPAADDLSGPDALRDAAWLARRYAVSVLPSVSSLKALRTFARSARASLPFLGIGDPVLKDHPPADQMRGAVAAAPPPVAVGTVLRGAGVDMAALRALPSLPETAGELAAEAKLFGAGPNALMLRDAATVAAVKRADLSDRRVIAFATHALVAGEAGAAEPGLVLTPPAAPSPSDDGLLKASDIATLKLNADLVILSACNTAASDGTPGAEGFSGLSKAFLYAGARSLLVSHWAVVSVSTVPLMTGLARHLEAPGVGRAEALRRAQLEILNDRDHPDFAHPMFWAPFVVVGDGA